MYFIVASLYDNPLLVKSKNPNTLNVSTLSVGSSDSAIAFPLGRKKFRGQNVSMGPAQSRSAMPLITAMRRIHIRLTTVRSSDRMSTTGNVMAMMAP